MKDPFAMSQSSRAYPAIQESTIEPTTTIESTQSTEQSNALALANSVETDSLNVQVNTEKSTTTAPDVTSEDKHFTGNVGKLVASFNLVLNESGTARGSYYYNKNPAKTYELQGTISDDGKLYLIEYTRGVETAKCHLTLEGGCYTGVMNNTDGRNFVMKMCD